MVELATVAEEEDDDLLHLLDHGAARTVEARRWLAEQVGAEESSIAMRELEGFDEVLRTLLTKLPIEALLPALPMEELLAGLPPEQRVAGLTPEQRLLLAPDEVLRLLPDDYLRSLPEDVRAQIRARIGRPL
ncbi:hypothetical protein [Sorangium sp. So ce887]|uniref:hypothetical protein n=1 Tax=Sorangium sp. So ce887 TaxID=3133324 RepID=UPI003F612DD8